jgi:TonB family protein
LFAAVLALGTGYAAWATQPAQAPARARVFESGDELLQVVARKNGEITTVAVSRIEFPPAPMHSPGEFVLEYAISPPASGQLGVDARVLRNGKLLSAPSVRFARGKTASIALEDEGIAYEFLWDTHAALRTSGATTPAPAREVSYSRLAPPKYPADAMAEKAQGTVMLRVLVDVLGAPAQVEIETSSGDDRLDQAAVVKVRQDWRFNPLVKNGKPEQQWVLVPITFSLDGPPAQPLPASGNRLDEIYIAPRQ